MLLSSINHCFSQPQHYNIKHYTTNEGLPQNSVLNVQFDKSGYCWLATEAGLVRFDNNEFVTYAIDNVPAMLDSRIHQLIITLQGQVLGKNQHRQEITTTPINKLFAPSAYISAKISPYYYPISGYAVTYDQIDILWDSIKNSTTLPLLRHYYATQNGDTYLAYSNYIFQIKPQNHRLLKTWANVPVTTGPVGDYLLQLWMNNTVAVWKNGQLLTTTQLTGDILQDSEFLKKSSKFFWSPGGTFLYINENLYQIEIQGTKVNAKKVLSGLPIKDIECINYQSSTNTYYIGTTIDGLYVIKSPIFNYPVLPAKSSTRTFYAIGKTSKDDLIVNNAFIPKNKPSTYIDLSTYQYRAYVDQKDQFYYQSSFELYRHNFTNHKDDNILPLDDYLANILPSSNPNELLICTRRSLTLLQIKGDQKRIIWKKSLPVTYGKEGVNEMYPLQDKYYILNTSNGAKWYNIATNKIEKSILDSINLFAFYKDSKGRLWFGSDGLGIFLYHNNQVYKTPHETLKGLNSTHAFIDDGKGHFWLPTNNGLYKVNIDSLANYLTHKSQTLYLYSFNKTDGLRSNEFNGANSSYQWLSDSTLVLASMNGLVEFKPNQLKLNYPDNQIFLDEFSVDSVKLQPETLKETSKLDPDFNLLTIKISCPYFGNSNNLQLEYAIHRIGFPVHWQTLPANGKITINNLSAGNYAVIVKKSGYALNDKNSNLTIYLSVLPHFYNTWLFYILLMAAIFLIVYIVFRIRISRLQNDKQKIEAIVAQRTNELHNTAEQLRHSEGALRQSNQQKELIITMVLHDLRSPLRFLKTVTGGIMNTFHSEMSTNLSNSLNKLNGSAVALWEFTDRFFTWAVTQQEDFKIEKTIFPLQEAFNTVATFYSEIVIVNDNKLLIEDTDIICLTDINILVLTIRNLIDNANKNTMGGTIRLAAYLQDDTISITVQDEGKGLGEAEINLFKSMSRPAHANKGQSGIGSQVIQNMLQKIDGELAIESSPKGSKFTLKLRK